MAYCAVCFDVKKEGADLSSGHKGVGACVYYDANKVLYKDYNFFGAVEASGSDEFKFLPKEDNDWSYEGDAGFNSFDSAISWGGPTSGADLT